MNVIKNDKVICFDVDDTLVLWEEQKGAVFPMSSIDIECPHDESMMTVYIHQPHVKLLKNHLSRGSTVLVWSQGGHAWAEAVIRALDINHENLYILSKPLTYVDDLPVTEWMKDRIYISPGSAWGRGVKE